MIILSLDSSSKNLSVAINNNNMVLCEISCNSNLKHSEIIISTIKSALRYSNLKIKDIDVFAVTNGPGSFTGIRTGLSIIKSMSFSTNKQIFVVSSLEALAYNLLNVLENITICSCISLNNNKVYSSTFKIISNEVVRVSNDKEISNENLISELSKFDEQIYLVGEDSEKIFGMSNLNNLILVSENLRYLKSSLLSYKFARNKENNKILVKAENLNPNYLSICQAEKVYISSRENR
ncbi:MAG: tRNA (adenosine(37)-N6)-threonylcarbamoyltransferase complex dimerization subunit type 1 [Candidatus Paraimprobicoccus trichonymphae]|uniref:tRNA (Adenosine(37)-N6)-threonylcarbamoyltransferase complex dimerization subunit type 1 n=1 Tax=Candidatus Paraimprobicoccus trichonymphae TaxID=3033793 RepID=A0AA48HWC8_9FIRM|nr:MAG: tRNA (adenosine(37)-N6)-threonylcarbamoyltransferase complex dimerization subunit type 1 [Candidatus Paraimprobicoccus trichonymphae]